MMPPTAKQWQAAHQLIAVDARNRVFWKILHQHLSGERLRLASKDPIEILNLACGEGEETRALSAFFGGQSYDQPSSRVHVTGIDMKASSLTAARTLAELPAISSDPSSFVVVPKADFVLGDATRPEELPHIPPLADFILIRHQFLVSDLLEQKMTWVRLLEAALKRLHPEGKILLTSYKEAEHLVLQRVLEVLPCAILRAERNADAIPLGDPKHPEVAFDHFITVIGRHCEAAKRPRQP